MSGITDAPSADWRNGMAPVWWFGDDRVRRTRRGQREARVRSEGRGVSIHVVQLAGCEARWMAEGARIAQAQGADIIDINMGCPPSSDQWRLRLGADARSRSRPGLD